MADAENLKTTIDQLHEELASVDNIDDDVKAMLQQTVVDIQGTLSKREAGEQAATEHASLVRRLSDAARDFEDSHPALSGIIGSIVDTLGRMGI